jgi:hypothetical protein
LVSDQVGIAREIALDEAGLVTQLEQSAIRRAVETLTDNHRLRRLYAKRGLACVKRRYEIGMISRQMADAYRTIIRGVASGKDGF